MKPLAIALLLAGTACSAPAPETASAPPAPAAVADDGRAAPPPPRAQPHMVVQAVEGTTTLAVGQVLEIALEGSAGTGHAWELESDGAPQLQREPVPPAPDVAPADGRGGRRRLRSAGTSVPRRRGRRR
ncbi:MAG: hypothetical protein KIS72_00120 [Luteimonas sp.]|nr:hypothetical protein [Luteimonas sp.]